MEASDEDKNTQLTYTIKGSSIFKIDGNKVYQKQNTLLNYEEQNSYTLRIRATDDGTLPLSTDTNLTINVLDVNEKPIMDDQIISIDENSVFGTVVTQISALDVDAGQQFSYKIIDGNDIGIFSIISDTGEISIVIADLDYESRPKHVLTIEATDNGTPELATSATITINVNDKPILNDARI